VIGERVTASKSLWKRAYLGFWPWPADEFTVYKKGGRPGHALIQTENAISFSYLPIVIGLGNLPSCGGPCPLRSQIARWTVFPIMLARRERAEHPGPGAASLIFPITKSRGTSSVRIPHI
jgi:hypothetical protein